MCDGFVDCPSGDDEDQMLCQLDVSRPCPGMLRCHNTNICVPKWEICDGQQQCPLSEDEAHCLPCPQNCTCYFQAVSCDNVTILEITKFSMYQILTLHFILTQNIQDILGEFNYTPKTLLYLEIINSNIAYFFGERYLNMFFLNLSSNKLFDLVPEKVTFSPSILYLDLSCNDIIFINSSVFPPYLEVLDLRNNKIGIIPSSIWHHKIVSLNLEGNTIFAIGFGRNLFNIHHISTSKESYWILCSVSKIYQNNKKICQLKLPQMIVSIFATIVSVILLVARLKNSLSVILHREKIQMHIMYHSLLIPITDLFLLLYIIVNCTFLLNNIDNYIGVLVQVSSPPMCLSVKCVVLFCLNSNILIDLYNSVVQFIRVKDPFAQLKMNLFTRTSVVVTFVLQVGLSLRFPNHSTDGLTFVKEVQYPLCLATTFGAGKSAFVTGVTILSSVLGVAYMVFQCCTYYLLIGSHVDSVNCIKEKIYIGTFQRMKLFFKLIIIKFLNSLSLIYLIFTVRSYDDSDVTFISFQIMLLMLVLYHVLQVNKLS